MRGRAAVDEGLFTWPSDDPRLRGSRCAGCGVVTFPVQSGCPRCFSERMEEVLLPRRGTLWTFTTQQFRPKSPPDGPYLGPDTEATFEPYAVGYIELEGHCKVEARLEGPIDAFEIGMEMELLIVPFRTEEDSEIMTYAFRPVTP